MARLHPAQRKIAQSPTRFKVLRCGRRFGKTTYAVEEMTGACLFEPGPVAYFATTRDQARDIVWAELLEKVIGTSNYVSHNEQRLEVTLRRPDGTSNRIRLFGWENIETARGKKYSLVVLDELDSMRAFEKQWREVIRATLTDYRGGGLFMSRMRPSTCWKIRYSSRSDTSAIMPNQRRPRITAGQPHVPRSGTPQGGRE